jgi:hypothetical protein
MSFSLAPLLLHSSDIPVHARAALRSAYEAPADERVSLLESAARILHHEVDLDCSDARELVGLASGSCC